MVVSSVFANAGNWTCNWDGWAIDRYELAISIDLHNEWAVDYLIEQWCKRHGAGQLFDSWLVHDATCQSSDNGSRKKSRFWISRKDTFHTHVWLTQNPIAMRRRDPLAHGNYYIVQNSKTLEGILDSHPFLSNPPKLLFGALTPTAHSTLTDITHRSCSLVKSWKWICMVL